MIKKKITLNETFKQLQFTTAKNNFILNVSHVDEKTKTKIGDVHSYNCKLDTDNSVYVVIDEDIQAPLPLSGAGKHFLNSIYSFEVYIFELVEITRALKQMNSRGVSAKRYL